MRHHQHALRQGVILLGLLFLGTASAPAQDLLPKAPAQSRDIVIENATLHPVSGEVIRNGRIHFSGGVIQSLGHIVVDGDDLERIDAKGAHVYPGFICAASSVGLTEVGSVEMTQDIREAGSFKPEVRAAVAVNPDSWIIPVTRRNGVLTCGVLPGGGRVPGWASVIQLDGWTWEDMALDQKAGLCVSWPSMGGGRRFGPRPVSPPKGPNPAILALTEFFDVAEAYLAAKTADPGLATDLRLETLGPILSGKKPVYISASSKAQIETAVQWAVERGLEPRIIGGRDAALCADLLVRHDVPVAITSTHRLPHRRDLSFATTYELPAQLEEAGVKWCLSYGSRAASSVRNLPYEAAASVPYGLDREVAVRSITLSAAEFLGVDDRLGSLERGKQATLFVADGDPFELTTTIQMAFIDGRRIDLRDKQTELSAKYREKYRQLGLLEDEQKSEK